MGGCSCMTDGPAAPNAPAPPPKTYFDELPKKESLLSRRDFIKTSVKLAVAGALIPGALSQLLPAVAPAALSSTGAAPVIKRDPATNAKIPVTIADLAGRKFHSAVKYTGGDRVQGEEG